MRTLKTFLVFTFALAALAFCAPKAEAQIYNQGTATITSNSVTITSIAATATNTTVRASIPATRAEKVAVQAEFALAGSGTSVVVFKFQKSIDGGSNWTTESTSLSVTANGTNTVSGVVSIDLGATGYLRLSSVENPNGQAITGLVLKYAQKYAR